MRGLRSLRGEYDSSDFNTACQATSNLYGGMLTNLGEMRFGQPYNQAGVIMNRQFGDNAKNP